MIGIVKSHNACISVFIILTILTKSAYFHLAYYTEIYCGVVVLIAIIFIAITFFPYRNTLLKLFISLE